MEEETEIATLAGGCFWCLEAVFEQIQGVMRVVSGYVGGHVANPSYAQVCTGATEHAEAVQITFDPCVISFRELLNVFFSIHDPTTLNRQGPDVGTQYRSAIFYHNTEQEAEAKGMIGELEASHVWDQPIVTDVQPFTTFYPAEDYHQQYYRKNLAQPYCRAIVAPKLAKLRTHFAARLKA
ncbi:MAG: peptide-methionine (S)-S-oxide reductase MsrA [Chloroflexi bacterium]|nr:peptide-methionine (S)-S-oxide reductase MsrA [Chloroflexota bacterium]